MTDKEIYDICIQTAHKVNNKYYNIFDIDELANIGFVAVKSNPSYNTFACAYLWQKQYAYYYCIENKRHVDKFAFYVNKIKVNRSTEDFRLDFIDAFNKLPEEDKNIIKDVLLENKTYKSILDKYGKHSESSIQNIYQRSLSRLRSLLKGYSSTP